MYVVLRGGSTDFSVFCRRAGRIFRYGDDDYRWIEWCLFNSQYGDSEDLNVLF